MKVNLGYMLLKLFGLPSNFTGQIVINFHKGGMSKEAHKTLTIKAVEGV